MKIRSIKHGTIGLIVIHIILWGIYIFYELSILLVLDPSAIKWNEMFLGFILNAGLFYTTVYWVLPKGSVKKQPLPVLLKILVIISTYLFAAAVLAVDIFPASGYYSTPLVALFGNKVFLAQHIWRASWFFGLGVGFWFATKSVQFEKKLRLLEKNFYLKEIHEIELRQQVAISQLAFFKSQINPHFLFNTLNFFYSSIYPLSRQLAQSLLLLSNIMRYAMNKDDESGFVELETEIKLIEDYIHLNQLRFSNSLQINFQVVGIPDHKKVISFLMMTLVENAFKYGDLTDAEYPLYINLHIYADKMEMQIHNKINALNLQESHGIGLQNMESRLKLIYKDNYHLSVNKDETTYKCNLKLKFN
jgi:two-component system LytT family sensor kinase